MRLIRRLFTYSKWDGSQAGFELDAQSLLDHLTDELLYHGDLDAALRRMMQRGMRAADGGRMEGLAGLLERLRAKREQILDQHDLGGVYQEISEALNEIVDTERAALAPADERQAHLDLLPDDLAGKVRDLQQYEFASPAASEAFAGLLERLRQQLMQQAVDQMSSAMREVSPEAVSRMKDMMAELNEMIARRERGEDPRFERFMEQYGDFFPENPRTLDELLQHLAARMAAMQAMLDSMSPEQRAQLQELSDQLLGDMDLQWQMDQLGRSLQSMMPDMFGAQYEFRGDQQMGMGQAMQAMQDLGELDRLEHLLRNATNPGQLSEADLDRVRELLGDDAAQSMDQLAQLATMLEDAGFARRDGNRLTLTPKGLRQIGNASLRDLFGSLTRDKTGQHQVERLGHGHERSFQTKPYEYGDPFNLDLQRTIRNALRRGGPGTPVTLAAEDFEIEQTEHLTRSATVLMLDLSQSMPLRDNFLPAKKVAMALHSLITSQFPRDYLGLIGFASRAQQLTAAMLPEVTWDYQYGTNMQHGFAMARQMLAGQSGTKQIIMITDGEPTAHLDDAGRSHFNYPPVRETIETTMREVVRCTRAGIRINSYVLDVNDYLRAFIEQVAAVNRGRVFYTTPDTLGDYVLVDFLEHRHGARRGRRAG